MINTKERLENETQCDEENQKSFFVDRKQKKVL